MSTALAAGPLEASDAGLVEACACYAREAMSATSTPGLSVALARKGRLIWQQAFGMADLSRKLPMMVDTTFPGGSLSKTYVAIAVMQLLEREVLELHAPVKSYAPDLPLCNPLGERDITVYDLLTFRSGLSADLADHRQTPQELQRYLRGALRGHRREYRQHASRWTAKVGTKYQYSNLGIAVLGHVVERLNPEGLCFGDYVDRHIVEPLGLSNTGFARAGRGQPAEHLLARRCVGYARFGRFYIPTPLLHPSTGPASSVVMTPGDYALLLLAIMDFGRETGSRIIRPDLARLMLTPQVKLSQFVPEGEPEWWAGIGLELTRLGEPGFSFGYTGSLPWGWWIMAAAFPHHDAVIVAACNRWDMPRWFNPPLELAPGLVVQFVRQWLAGERSVTQRGVPTQSWTWRVSWAIGFSLAERTLGLLGAEGALDDPEVERIAGEVVPADDAHATSWDPDGFRAGVRAMRAIAPTAEGIRSFLQSGEAPVSGADMPLIALAFGHRGGLSLPQPYFAQSANEAVEGPSGPAAFGGALERKPDAPLT